MKRIKVVGTHQIYNFASVHFSYMIYPKNLRNLQKRKGRKFPWGPKLGAFTVYVFCALILTLFFGMSINCFIFLGSDFVWKKKENYGILYSWKLNVPQACLVDCFSNPPWAVAFPDWGGGGGPPRAHVLPRGAPKRPREEKKKKKREREKTKYKK
jgi:hypothetical protein